MKALVVGDGFIGAGYYRDAIAAQADQIELDVADVDLPGAKAEQHAAQQVMERSGANAVEVPGPLLAAAADADAVCVHFAPVGAALLAAAPRLGLVAVARAGLENVDVDEATRRGVGVVPSFGRNAGAVAELQIGLMLAEARNIARADASVKGGGWRKAYRGTPVELADSTVGMVGFGHVGRVFARRLAGFAPRMLAFDPYVSDAELERSGVHRAGSLDEVFSGSDFVVVMARHTPETDRMIGRRELALMRPGAYFVNVSRSRLVDTTALLETLRAGRIAGAGLDVFDEEPLPADSPWRTLDNVTLTTHFGGDTDGTNRTSARLVADAVVEFARTGRVRHAVNAAELGWR